MKTCSKDHTHDISDNSTDNFCWFCGSPMVESHITTCTCGNIPFPSDKFCVKCGKDLKELISSEN